MNARGSDNDMAEPARRAPLDRVPVVRSVARARVPGAAGLRVGELVKALVPEIQRTKLGAFAGNLTYHGLFALFPFVAFLLSLLGIFQARGLVNDLIDQARGVLPASAVTLLRDNVLGPVAARSDGGGAYGVAAVIGLVVALYGVSGAMRSVMEAVHQMHEHDDTRGFVAVYLQSFLLAVGAAVLFVGALVLVIAGTAIADAIADASGVPGLGTVASVVRWPLLLFAVLVGFALIYRFALDPAARRSEPKVKPITIGAVIAVVAWVIFSLAFNLYVSNFFNAGTYGALAGVAIFLLYLYFASFILLLGALIDHVVDVHRDRADDAPPPPVRPDAADAPTRAEPQAAERHPERRRGPSAVGAAALALVAALLMLRRARRPS